VILTFVCVLQRSDAARALFVFVKSSSVAMESVSVPVESLSLEKYRNIDVKIRAAKNKENLRPEEVDFKGDDQLVSDYKEFVNP
jgi:hypothetical protein